MPRVSEWKPSDPVRILIWAKSKVGKTWFGYTFPRVVSFDFDNGVATARNPEFVKKYGLRDIFYEQFAEAKMRGGIATAHNAFDDACRYFDEWMKPAGKWRGYEVGRDQFDTFVVDSATTLSEFAMNKGVIILGGHGLSKSQEQAVASGLLTPKKQDYGAERSLTEQFVDMVMDSGKNVVLICHERETYEGEGANMRLVGIGPLLTGKSQELIPLKFDEVYNLRIRPKGPVMARELQTQADGLRKVGSRYGIPDGTEPSYEALKKEIDRIYKVQHQQTELTLTTK